MNLKYKFVKRKILDDIFLVPIGEAAAKFNGIIMINEIASYIFDQIPECNSAEEITESLIEKYNVDPETASNDVEMFFGQLKENGII